MQFLHKIVAYFEKRCYNRRMKLKELRKNKKLTQAEAAEYLGIPLRTYVNYEKDESKRETLKYRYMTEKLSVYGYVDEENGVLTVKKIEELCLEVLKKYSVDYCYLFGSYAKGTATPESDVDLLVSTTATGLEFFSLVEELRERLRKRVDVLDQRQLKDNFLLVNEILKDGMS